MTALITGLLVCGCTLVEQHPPDSDAGLQPDNATFVNILKDRYSQDPNLLVGTCEWQFPTVHHWGEKGLHTETEEETVMLQFNADGTVETYRNGQQPGSESHAVKQRDYGNGRISEDPVLFMGGSSAEFAVSRDTLLISTVYRDGPESIFARSEGSTTSD